MARESEYIQNDLEVDGTAYLTDATIGALTVTEGLTLTGGSTFDHIEVTGEAVFNTLSGNVGIGTTMTGAIGTKFAVLGGNVGIGTTSAQGGFVVTNGNVGIGTWAPAGLFQVNGLANSPMVVTSGGNVGIGTTSAQGAFVVTNGNVGIGTWAPAVKMEIDYGSKTKMNFGSETYVPSNYYLWSFFTDESNNNFKIQTNVAGLNWGNLILQGEAGNVGIGTTTPIGGLVVMNGNVGIGTWVPVGLLQVNGLTNSPVVVTSGGNVGIGTWVPAGALDIKTGNNVLVESGKVGIGTTLPSSGLSVGSNGISIGVNYTNGTSAPANGLAVQGNVGIGTTIPGGILTAVGGNVGIGTWNPQALLDISTGGATPLFLGTMARESEYVQNDLEVDGTAYLTDAIIGSLTVTAGITSTGGSTFDHIEVTGESVFNTLSGNVGIGTTMTGAIGTKFAVLGGNVGIGTTSAQGGFVVTNGNVGIGTWAPAGRLQVASPTTTPFLIDTNGNVGIGTIITSNAGLSVMNGNVGIGTWLPAVTIDVRGQIGLDGTQVMDLNGGNLYVKAGGSANYIALQPNNSVYSGAIYGNGNVGLGGTSANILPALMINGITGNVGIDTTLSANRLDVQGGVGIGTAYAGYQSAPPNGLIVQGNVGLGTATPQTGLVSMGNVGIGTWTANSALQVVGNVGIGSVAPYGSLDVGPAGTICFGSSCKTSWANANNYWALTAGTGNVGVSTTNTVGIGTTSGIGAGLVVMNGNVGIGTWAPGDH